ncbi:helix-turn-helix transcriptional regulator [Halomicrobium salinisoli]|uniref:helix-turn-helix transcriptional regulator n=1 Tax=Halomicrobium salinisoli TaxID=2878391 RepID=UPI001CF0366D|nr:hypothetical protein [Halomicrobium salinisoli]
MRRQVLWAVALLVVVAALVPAAGSADGAGPLLAQPDGFDRTTFEVTVTENGSAEWTVKHSRRLANESERQQFEDYADRFRSEETDLYRNFVARAGRLVDVGENQTGREMRATAFDRDASVNVTTSFTDRGTVSLSFHWHGFARTDGDRVVVSDVFAGAFYIGEDQSMVIERGPNLAFARVEPEPTTQSSPGSLTDSEMVTWEGEREFGPSRPYVEFGPRELVEDGDAGAGETDGTASDGSTTALPAEGDSGGLMWMAGAVVLLVALVGGAVFHFGRPDVPWNDGDGGAAAAEASAPEPDPEPESPAVPEEELLSDSDRVLKLLEDNGGRMKQVNIVDETEWSKSKVSMLLSDMEEDGEISKLRVGRENIISIAGEEPEAAGSPFEDDE